MLLWLHMAWSQNDLFNLLLSIQLKMMSTVHQTQPTIQLLLSTNEFVGALDLISTTQEVLAQELQGIVCFRWVCSCVSSSSYKFIGYGRKSAWIADTKEKYILISWMIDSNSTVCDRNLEILFVIIIFFCLLVYWLPG